MGTKSQWATSLLHPCAASASTLLWCPVLSAFFRFQGAGLLQHLRSLLTLSLQLLVCSLFVIMIGVAISTPFTFWSSKAKSLPQIPSRPEFSFQLNFYVSDMASPLSTQSYYSCWLPHLSSLNTKAAPSSSTMCFRGFVIVLGC